MGQQQFAPQQQQFAPQQQFQQQPQAPPQIPTSQLTLEDIALTGFSRDENQDGQIDALPPHLQQAPQQFAPQQQQQFAPQQQQQFAPQPQQPRQFRGPAPVGPSPAQNFQTGF